MKILLVLRSPLGWRSYPILLLTMILWVGPAPAAMVERFSLEELSQKSVKIVIGQCMAMESRWNAKGTLILTYWKFAVRESLKGAGGAEIVVVTPGGTVGNKTQKVAGMPSFQTGQEAMLFLEPVRGGGWQTLGMGQGKFQIRQNPRSGAREALQSLQGLDFYPSSGQEKTAEQDQSPIPLERLIQRVRGALSGPISE